MNELDSVEKDSVEEDQLTLTLGESGAQSLNLLDLDSDANGSESLSSPSSNARRLEGVHT
jgi:hypothetical protein